MPNLLSTYQLVVIGCGQMGGAIARGVVNTATMPASLIHCLDADVLKAKALATELGAIAAAPPASRSCPKIFLLAVKPHQIKGAIRALDFSPDDLLISVAAGIPWQSLSDWSAHIPQVVRTMPNTPCLVGEGVVGVFAPVGKADAGLEVSKALFAPIATVVPLEKESFFDGLTALSGSGPATMFLILEALADAAVLEGLDRQTARLLASHTMRGAASLAIESPLHTAELKDAVASPGGTTIASVRELERGGLRATLMASVAAAAARSRTLSEDA